MAVFTESERVEVWDRRQAGESNRSIGRRLGRSAASKASLERGVACRRPSHLSGSQVYLPLDFLPLDFLPLDFLPLDFLPLDFLPLDLDLDLPLDLPLPLDLDFLDLDFLDLDFLDLDLSVDGVVAFEAPGREVEGRFTVPTAFRSRATVRSATARCGPIPLTCSRLAGSALAIDSIVVNPASTKSCDVAGPMPGRSVSGVVTGWVSARRRAVLSQRRASNAWARSFLDRDGPYPAGTDDGGGVARPGRAVRVRSSLVGSLSCTPVGPPIGADMGGCDIKWELCRF